MLEFCPRCTQKPNGLMPDGGALIKDTGVWTRIHDFEIR